jgi:hypothetical protein
MGPILAPVGHALVQIALLIRLDVVAEQCLSVLSSPNAPIGAVPIQGFAEPIAPQRFYRRSGL